MYNFDEQHIKPYIIIKTSRSSGAGGQHVNKTETKVTIHFNAQKFIDEKGIELEYQLQLKKIKYVSSQKHKSQVFNRAEAMNRLLCKINKAFRKDKKRLKTSKPKEANERRLKTKKYIKNKKENRRKPKI
jgi:ribosome-associated protein